MYLIRHLCHDNRMGGHGFSIDLAPAWQQAVAASKIDQASINRLLTACGRIWLDQTGFDAMFDPDDCGFRPEDEDGPKAPRRPGPLAEKLYQPLRQLSVQWGEWGPEHISVPGNACGLDIDRDGFAGAFEDGARLHPHNVDSLGQKYLLLIVFTEIAEQVYYRSREFLQQ